MSTRTFDEWAKDRRAWDCSAGEVHFFDAYGIHRSVDDDRARAIWNAAREGIVPADTAAHTKCDAQCPQVHKFLDSLLEMLGLPNEPGLYTVNKSARVVCEIKRLQEAAPAQEWVSVEERLPEICKRYLVSKDGDVTEAVYHPGSKQWEACNSRTIISPTHWMPLPPPSKSLSPFKKWWNSLPTHAGSDPDTFRVIAGECVHVNTAMQVWKECEGVRGGGK